MKIIIVGHSGSQKIVPASKYLTGKYLPMFDIIYLNYKGGINGWGMYIAGFLQYLNDEHVIFALDDYLVSAPIDMEKFKLAERDIKTYPLVKLCHCTMEENLEYPVTTQYTIWKKEYLIELLYKTFTPWRFELDGSKMFAGKVATYYHCIKYFTNSSLSSRWEGVRLDGLNEEDIKHIKENGLIN